MGMKKNWIENTPADLLSLKLIDDQIPTSVSWERG